MFLAKRKAKWDNYYDNASMSDYPPVTLLHTRLVPKRFNISKYALHHTMVCGFRGHISQS